MEQKKSLKQLQADEARKKDKVKKLTAELNAAKKELGALAKAIAAAKKAEANKKAAKKPAKKK
jgi:cell division septum initiation protein DivIVA